MAIDITTLKRHKNNVIGNPTAKLALASNFSFLHALVGCLNDESSEIAVQIEAAQIISSLSYGSSTALETLLRVNAHGEILQALYHSNNEIPLALRSALARALRAVAVATADAVGPALWGLGNDTSLSGTHDDAKLVYDYFFQLEVLDVYLPLLEPSLPRAPESLGVPLSNSGSGSGSRIATAASYTNASPGLSIAQLLAFGLRTQPHREAIVAWQPEHEREKQHAKEMGSKGRRGWEKITKEGPGDSSKEGGGWVARKLVEGLKAKETKVQEAMLGALAALAKDNPEVATLLAQPTLDSVGNERPSALSLALTLCKSRLPDVQLAAALCATHIIRAGTALNPSSSSAFHPHPTLTHSHSYAPAPHPHSSSLAHTLFHHSSPPPAPAPMPHSPSTSAHAPSHPLPHPYHPVSAHLAYHPPPTSPGASHSYPHPHPHSPASSPHSLHHGPGHAPGGVGNMPLGLDKPAAMTVLHVLNRIIGGSSVGAGANAGGVYVGRGAVVDSNWNWTRARACFVLHHLITDEKELSQTAFDRGSLGRLAALVKAITPIPSSTSSTNGNGHGADNGEVNASGLGMGISSIGSGLGMGTSVGSGLGTFGSIGSMHTSGTDGALAGNGVGNGVTGMSEGEDWEEEEAESVGRLREAALTAISTLALSSPEIRTAVTDVHQLLPIISVSIAHRLVGVRFAACQCVRSLSRSVAVARTSLVDSGLGMKLFKEVFMKGFDPSKHIASTTTSTSADISSPYAISSLSSSVTSSFSSEDEGDDVAMGGGAAGVAEEEGGGEDRRVLYAALLAICNLVNEHSPLRQPFVEAGLIPRLASLMTSSHVKLRLNALWAVKNLIYRCDSAVKREVMRGIGWGGVERLLRDLDPGVQEQAFYVIRNYASSEEDIDVIFHEVDSEKLVDAIVDALESKTPDVVVQAAWALCNLTNGTQDHQSHILSNPEILHTLRTLLADSPTIEVRRAAVASVLEIAKTSPWKHAELRERGFPSTLRHLCEGSGSLVPAGHGVGGGGYVGGPGGGMIGGGMMSVEREVRDKARMALDWIEHGPEGAGLVI